MTLPVALVTGFGPFLDVVDNPSARVAGALDGEVVAGHQVIAAVLPVDYREARAALAALAGAHAPSCVLALGVARGDLVRLERGADNRVSSERPDATGAVWAGRALTPGGPARLRSPLPIARWAEELDSAGLRVVPSDDAGGYVCNATYHRLLELASDMIPSLFVHIPSECAASQVRALADLCRRLLTRLATAGVQS